MSHPFVARLIGSIRRELLDHTFFWTATDLESKLSDYQCYYKEYRTHSGRDGETPVQRAAAGVANINEYPWEKLCRGLFQLPIALDQDFATDKSGAENDPRLDSAQATALVSKLVWGLLVTGSVAILRYVQCTGIACEMYMTEGSSAQAAVLSGITEIRLHGRGGQGNVAATWLLAAAAIREGRFAQAFPAFGAERRGAPVAAFVRIADRRLRRRSQILEPGFLIIQDPGLLAVPDVLNGLHPKGAILVNSDEDSAVLSRRLERTVVALPAGDMARDTLGHPLPNTALLAAFVALTALVSRESLETEVAERFQDKGGEVVARNLDLIAQASAKVVNGQWREAAHAASA